MEETKLSKLIKGIAWSYVAIHLHINLGYWDIFPDWGGYGYIWLALPFLAKEVSSASLLRPLTVVLTVWSGLCWILAGKVDGFVGMLGYFGPIAESIITVISLYFHYQLLTDLAQLAAKYRCRSEARLLRLRTIRVIAGTLYALPLPWESSTVFRGVYALLTIVHVVAAFGVCRALFVFRKELRLQGSRGCEEQV